MADGGFRRETTGKDVVYVRVAVAQNTERIHGPLVVEELLVPEPSQDIISLKGGQDVRRWVLAPIKRDVVEVGGRHSPGTHQRPGVISALPV